MSGKSGIIPATSAAGAFRRNTIFRKALAGNSRDELVNQRLDGHADPDCVDNGNDNQRLVEGAARSGIEFVGVQLVHFSLSSCNETYRERLPKKSGSPKGATKLHLVTFSTTLSMPVRIAV